MDAPLVLNTSIYTLLYPIRVACLPQRPSVSKTLPEHFAPKPSLHLHAVSIFWYISLVSESNRSILLYHCILICLIASLVDDPCRDTSIEMHTICDVRRGCSSSSRCDTVRPLPLVSFQFYPGLSHTVPPPSDDRDNEKEKKGDNACMLHSRVRPLASECCKLATVQVLSAPYRFNCALESSCARPSRCFAKLFIDHFCLVLSERLAISPKIEMQCRPMQR